ncbi:outer membrane lipoprotein-sorting protein [Verrucomicrobia bacterium]|nr:outer membrane lipoprotein-sorting protein [Verrucomicrobiota bacterium]
MKIIIAILTLLLLVPVITSAGDKHTPEEEGALIALRILMQRPGTNEFLKGSLYTRVGRDKKTSDIQFQVQLNDQGWVTSYTSTTEEESNAVFIHHSLGTGIWFEQKTATNSAPVKIPTATSHSSFAGSAYWMSDLAYPKCSFFLWPKQKLIKKELRRGQFCYVLESTNPSPNANEYASAVSWIDVDTLGPLEIHTYGIGKKKWKEFRPKSFKKVNGIYEVEELEIRDKKTGVRSTITFEY